MLDTFFMQQALGEARLAERSPSPNPWVGAVVVKHGTIVGRGHHNGPGTKHAEEVAIDGAGTAARGATLYCNLEPCSHSAPEKHRPPCAPLVVRSGVDRVVLGQLDPNPAVSGRGKAILERAGRAVSVGVDGQEAIELNAGFNTKMVLRRPFVHIKVAQSLDGRLAAADGSSAWITDDRAREQAHLERGRCDAVAVGIGTVLHDDPLLTVRHGPTRRPYAVVFDSCARLPLTSRLLTERPEEVIVVVRAGADQHQSRNIEAAGAQIVEAADVEEALRRLSDLGICSVLVEGGRQLLTTFLQRELFDRVTVYVAPVLLGGPNTAIEMSPVPTMEQARRLVWTRSRTIGDQAVISGYKQDWVDHITNAAHAGSATAKDGTSVHRSC